VQPAQQQLAPPRIIPHRHVLAAATVAPPGTNCAVVACLALTFDDGPNPMTTPQVVTELEQAHVQATFFMVGSRIAGNEALLRQMHTDGDEIENHSWTHPDFTKLTVPQIQQQIQLTQQAVVNAGVPAPTMFRPPYGAVNATVEANVPLTILLWNEDPRDWAASTSAQVVQSTEATAKAGGIVDMHDIYHVTANALPQIITDLTARGFHFVTVSQLLNLTPTSRGLFYGHP
jgi:peptidoglycan/xylan/chitin deacetylase (PgdA/CDA1 family)